MDINLDICNRRILYVRYRQFAFTARAPNIEALE